MTRFHLPKEDAVFFIVTIALCCLMAGGIFIVLHFAPLIDKLGH